MSEMYMVDVKNDALVPVKGRQNGTFIYDATRDSIRCGYGCRNEYPQGHPFSGMPLFGQTERKGARVTSFVLSKCVGIPNICRIVRRAADANTHPIPRNFEEAWAWLRKNCPEILENVKGWYLNDRATVREIYNQTH